MIIKNKKTYIYFLSPIIFIIMLNYKIYYIFHKIKILLLINIVFIILFLKNYNSRIEKNKNIVKINE